MYQQGGSQGKSTVKQSSTDETGPQSCNAAKRIERAQMHQLILQHCLIVPHQDNPSLHSPLHPPSFPSPPRRFRLWDGMGVLPLVCGISVAMAISCRLSIYTITNCTHCCLPFYRFRLWDGMGVLPLVPGVRHQRSHGHQHSTLLTRITFIASPSTPPSTGSGCGTAWACCPWCAA